MTALTDTVDMLRLRHAAVVGVCAGDGKEFEMLAGDALDALSIDPDAADLRSRADAPRRAWRWTCMSGAGWRRGRHWALDFQADGGRLTADLNWQNRRRKCATVPKMQPRPRGWPRLLCR